MDVVVVIGMLGFWVREMLQVYIVVDIFELDLWFGVYDLVIYVFVLYWVEDLVGQIV